MSIAQLSVADFELTPQRVSFKGPGAAAFEDLGGTVGNVAVSISYKKYPLKADQAGTEPIDHKVGGLEVKVTTTLAQVQDKTKWLVAFPHAQSATAPITGCGVSAATPAVVSKNSHGLSVGDAFMFTAGTLPTGASLNTKYYVVASGFGANAFEFSTSKGGASVNTSGSAGVGITITPLSGALVAVDFYTNLGSGGQANSGELLLHPLSKPDADLSTDYLFYKACAMSASEVTYGPEAQVGLKVEWFIYPDMDNSQKYMRYGDATII